MSFRTRELLAATVLTFFATSCQHHGAAPVTAAAVSAEPCETRGAGSATTPWRLAQGAGFSLCLPPGWGPGPDARSFSSADGASIHWSTGGRPIDVITSRPITRTTTSDTYPPPVDTRPTRTTCMPSARSQETIGGHAAQLSSGQCGTAWNASVTWSDPQVFLAGSAPAARDVQRLFEIYRTVRFP
jgi:hypothetical protein